MIRGTIDKSTGGFYYVRLDGAEAGSEPLECRARGIFRKDGRRPCVGDRVLISRNSDGSGNIEELLPRKNHLGRPPLANLDYLVLVLSVTDPPPNLVVVDKLIAVLEHKGIEPLIAVTKADLADPDALEALYADAGFSVYRTDREGRDALTARLAGHFSAFAGNSGVGKSSLLNLIDPRLGLEVGDTSKKLGRGRHTTRHVETYLLENGGWVADTPGFTALDLAQMSEVTARELAGCFREFGRHVAGCRFLDCTHTCESDCAVLGALERGEIAPSRHRSYLQLYEELREVREWERR